VTVFFTQNRWSHRQCPEARHPHAGIVICIVLMILCTIALSKTTGSAPAAAGGNARRLAAPASTSPTSR
jgi:hypothetical protein